MTNTLNTTQVKDLINALGTLERQAGILAMLVAHSAHSGPEQKRQALRVLGTLEAIKGFAKKGAS